MSLFSKNKKESKKVEITPILPQEIYEAGILELKDIIAPSALKITPRELNLGDKIARTFFVISYPRIISMSRNEFVGHMKSVINKINFLMR